MVAALLVRETQRGVSERDTNKSVWGDAPERDVASLHGARTDLGPGQSAGLHLVPELRRLGGRALEVPTPADDLLINDQIHAQGSLSLTRMAHRTMRTCAAY